MSHIFIKESVTSKKKTFEDDFSNDKKYRSVKDHCHYTYHCRGPVHVICNLKHSIPKEILVVFHNGSNHEYHFIINELAKEFEGEFNCLEEDTNKFISKTKRS